MSTATPTGVGPARRTLDILVAGGGLVLVSPLLAVAAAAIKAHDGGPVFFVQQRVGEGGVPFGLIKLRTMTVGPAGAGVTAAGDPRITGVGRLLRRTAVDELPQLWLVLTGRMTLVGPRPESVDLAAGYPEHCREVLQARPGLTGPAQLRYRERSVAAVTAANPGIGAEECYLRELVPLRVAADLAYLRRPTLAHTLTWLVRTAGYVLGLADYQVRTVGSRA